MSGDPQYARDAASLTGILAEFEAQGFVGQFAVREAAELECLDCHQRRAAASYHMAALRRTEGASDPADMAAVMALTCPNCDVRGTLVVHYGPDAGREESDVLVALEDHRSDGGVIIDPSIGPGPHTRDD